MDKKLPDKKPRDKLRLFFNSLAITLIALAVMYEVAPYMDFGDPQIGEIRELDRQIVTVSSQDVRNAIAAKHDKPLMLVLYASWCGYCHLVMPVIADAMRAHELDNVEPLFISLDTQPRLLSKYLVHQGYRGLFTPYRLDSGMFENYTAMFAGTGSRYGGGIPFIGFFKDGKALGGIMGVTTKERLLRAVGSIK